MTDSSYLWPLSGAHRRITSPFGPRIHPVTGEAGKAHNGVDISCPQGSIIRAPCDGTVTGVWMDGTFGGGQSLTIVSLDGTIRFGFAHLMGDMVLVERGQFVSRGQMVAISGGTPGTPGAGRSTGPHLHLTVKSIGQTDVAIDPMRLRWDMWSIAQEAEASLSRSRR